MDVHGQAVNLFDHIGRDLAGGAGGVDASVLEEQDLVGVAQGGVEVVHGHDGGDAVAVDDVLEHVQDIDLALEVERAGGLVQEHEARFLDHGPGDRDLLQFAAGEFVDVAQGEAGHVQPFDGRVDHFQVLVRDLPFDVRLAAHEHGVEHGEPGRFVALGDVADGQGDLVGPHLEHVAVLDHDRAGGRGVDGVDALEQRGLAHAVGAEDGEQFAAVQGEVHLAEDGFAAVGEVEVSYLEHHRLCPLMMRQMNTGAPMKAVSTDTGRTCGARMSRATVSDTSRSRPPQKMEAGSRQRWSEPMMRRTMCGTTSPTKPMMPRNAMMKAVSMEESSMPTMRTRSTRTPRPRAVSSPASMALQFQLLAMKQIEVSTVTTEMMPSSYQEARAVSPKVQKTMAASCTSSAKNCRNMVPAVNSAPRATPVRTMTSGVAPRSLETPMITPAATRLKKKAMAVVRQGLVMFTASALDEDIMPPPRIMTEKAAPNAAAWEMPRVKGEPSGLRRMDCMAAPATDSPAPAMMAARAWGSRIFQMMASQRRPTSRPARLLATVLMGMPAAPIEMAAMSAATSRMTEIVIRVVFRPTYRRYSSGTCPSSKCMLLERDGLVGQVLEHAVHVLENGLANKEGEYLVRLGCGVHILEPFGIEQLADVVGVGQDAAVVARIPVVGQQAVDFALLHTGQGLVGRVVAQLEQAARVAAQLERGQVQEEVLRVPLDDHFLGHVRMLKFLAGQPLGVGHVPGVDKGERRIRGLGGLEAVRALGGHAAHEHRGPLVVRNPCGALAQVLNLFVHECDDRFRALGLAHHLTHDADGLVQLRPLDAQVAVGEFDHRDAGFLLQFVGIIAHAARVGLQDHLRLRLQGQDQFGVVVSPELAEDRHFLELRVGDGVRPRVERAPPRLDVVHGHDHVLRLQVRQQPQTTRPGADHALHLGRNLHRIIGGIRYGALARLGRHGQDQNQEKSMDTMSHLFTLPAYTWCFVSRQLSPFCIQ
eukprot:TRINITY_DN2492_c0_g1_i1.p1 TRINITY_DN2492_c0_g1~~TRINITY_DN2492_c0_g1_i1.p1  ORF type:complete len:986 (-),score=367.62 TRINITY_DN2492_c0_g1_i1:246-3203(-)